MQTQPDSSPDLFLIKNSGNGPKKFSWSVPELSFRKKTFTPSLAGRASAPTPPPASPAVPAGNSRPAVLLHAAERFVPGFPALDSPAQAELLAALSPILWETLYLVSCGLLGACGILPPLLPYGGSCPPPARRRCRRWPSPPCPRCSGSFRFSRQQFWRPPAGPWVFCCG